MESNKLLGFNMIVGPGEADILERCLKSTECIKKYFDEIAIVCTSDDKEVWNVAKKYTENVYKFEWIDDFSAARNYAKSKLNTEKVKKLLLITSRISMEKMREILGMEKDAFNDKIIDWGIEYGFKIDGDYIIVDDIDLNGFIDDLDAQFDDWTNSESTKRGKVE